VRVLEAVTADPDLPVSHVDVLGAAERDQLLVQWNDTAAELPPHTVPEMVAGQVARVPDAVAVTCEGELVTYAELAARSSRLASYLARLGAGPETVVGVCLPRGPEMVVALLAAWQAGAAYLPVDPDLPAERVSYMLADAGAVLVVTSAACGRVLPGEVAAVVVDDPATADRLAGTAGSTPPAAGRGGLRPEHPAYVMYTSGSTGAPKGVAVTHGGIANRLMWMQSWFGLKSGERVLHKTPFGFDVSVWELFWPLVQGAAMVVAAPGSHRDPGYVAGLIRDERVDTAHFVPPMLDAFLAVPQAADCDWLRRVVCSGEALGAGVRDRFVTVFGEGAGLFNLYGPTEASVDVTGCQVRAGDREAVPIGRPVTNTRAFVLDEWLSPVPVGVRGAARADGGAVRSRPVRPRRRWKPAVPDRGPGAVDRQRAADVHRPGRRPGQDPGIPGRAGRDRDGTGGLPAGRPGGGDRPRGHRRGSAAGRLRGPSRPGRCRCGWDPSGPR
jgi:amino acid adenylation domain-containing protein